MARVVLSLEYDGSSFEGWQSQTHGRTVQDVLQRAIGKIAGHEVGLSCAGRTDTGVHATMQVAHFDTEACRPDSAWVRGVNTHLPPAVRVKQAWCMETTIGTEAFHARFSAQARRYRYVLLNRPVASAVLNARIGWCHAPLSFSAMQEAAACLPGTRDFSAFRAAECQAKSPVRQLFRADVAKFGDVYVFDFEANGFLHHMVRNLVGALVHIGRNKAEPKWIRDLLAMKDRRLAPPTFSPAGLYLCGIRYPDHFGLPQDGNLLALPQIVI